MNVRALRPTRRPKPGIAESQKMWSLTAFPLAFVSPSAGARAGLATLSSVNLNLRCMLKSIG